MKNRQTDGQTDVRIAYICLCHTDPEFIGRVSHILRYKQDAIFIHVDKKTDLAPFIESCEGNDNVYFVTDRVKNYWGGFNSIVATMKTIELALSTGDYDRFVLLQGQDYPLFSPARIHGFFMENSNVEFCRAKDISLSKNQGEYMNCCGFWIHDFERKNIPLRIAASLFHRFNSLGIKYRPSTFKTKEGSWHIFKGWAQWALTCDCVKYILNIFNSFQEYNRFIKHRFPPDEIYFHTIIYNSRFKDSVCDTIIFDRDGTATLLNLTYFEYPVYVTVFTSAIEYDWLKNTGCLFVRKVNSTSAELLDRIDAEIEQCH